MRHKEKGPFLHAAMRAIHQTEAVLSFHRVAREHGAPMDLGPHTEAMLRLCEDQHLDNRPVEHLRDLKGVVEALRGSVDPDQLKAGEESAAKYEHWLCATFPGAFTQMRTEAAQRVRKQALN